MPTGGRGDLASRIPKPSLFSFKLTGRTAHIGSLGVLSLGSHYPTAPEILLGPSGHDLLPGHTEHRGYGQKCLVKLGQGTETSS